MQICHLNIHIIWYFVPEVCRQPKKVENHWFSATSVETLELAWETDTVVDTVWKPN
jgi:hypothetical protein